MKLFKLQFKNFGTSIFTLVFIAALIGQAGCATHNKNIAVGMLVGAAAGAAIGDGFADHGDSNVRTRNTVVSSILLSLITGGLMEWHYQELEAQSEEISGRYARYRLCDPDDMKPNIVGEFDLNNERRGENFQPTDKSIGKFAISLDDNTKWAIPIFRKRYLRPDLGETQMTSERYIWEIIKPGSFVTRSENPQYFFQIDKK